MDDGRARVVTDRLILFTRTKGDSPALPGLAQSVQGFVSIFFDTIFMLQHYAWYRRPAGLADADADAVAPLDDEVGPL